MRVLPTLIEDLLDVVGRLQLPFLTHARHVVARLPDGGQRAAVLNVGSDELELLVFFPAGFAWEVRYNIDVR
jgi:hypothetical protein